MKKEPPKDVAASIRARLYNLARTEQQDFNLVLNAYATERLLYRIGSSEFAHRFVLKGARLFALWSKSPQRPTRDLDLLGFDEPSPNRLRNVFRSVCQTDVEPDGLRFDKSTIVVTEIRASQLYDGQRVKLTAYLSRARIPLQIDVGYGDIVTPRAVLTDYTPLLSGLPSPKVLTYPRETVIAEKLHAMVTLDTLNTRMKDFYDLAILAGQYRYRGPALGNAIRATFDRRNTHLPAEVPNCLLESFAANSERQDLWMAFLKRIGLEHRPHADFPATVELIHEFLALPLLAVAQGKEASFEMEWSPDGGWVPIARE